MLSLLRLLHLSENVVAKNKPGPFMTAGRLAWQNADAIVRINLLWLALSVPIVTAPPALAGLYSYVHKLAREEAFPACGDFWQGFHALKWVAWRWVLLNLAAGVILAANLLFYGTVDATAARALTWGWTIVGANWFIVQGYVLPLLLLQEQPRLRTALRNALVIYIRHPVRTLAHALLAGMIAIVSSVALLPWALFTGAVLALLGTQVVLDSAHSHLTRSPEAHSPLDTDSSAGFNT